MGMVFVDVARIVSGKNANTLCRQLGAFNQRQANLVLLPTKKERETGQSRFFVDTETYDYNKPESEGEYQKMLDTKKFAFTTTIDGGHPTDWIYERMSKAILAGVNTICEYGMSSQYIDTNYDKYVLGHVKFKERWSKYAK